jgi:hypothetical protein
MTVVTGLQLTSSAGEAPRDVMFAESTPLADASGGSPTFAAVIDRTQGRVVTPVPSAHRR